MLPSGISRGRHEQTPPTDPMLDRVRYEPRTPAGQAQEHPENPRASLVHIEPDPAWGPLGEFARVYPEIFRSEASPPATEFGPIWRGLEVLARYFPGIPEEYVGSLELPAPLSQKFWREYGERVADFVGFAERLQSAIYYLTDTPLETALEHGQVTMSPEMVLSTGSGYDFWRGVRIINALLASSAPHLVITPDMTLSYAWSFPSLVSSFAMMIVQDIIEDRRVRSCDTCGVFFLSSSPRAKYCSPRCRNTAEKRRHRARKKSLANEEGRP